MSDRLLPWCGHCDWPENLCRCPDQEDPEMEDVMNVRDLK